MSAMEFNKFQGLTYESFRRSAKDDSLDKYEKIGFPASYRKGKEKGIFKDITRKLLNLSRSNQIILDIGCGCSDIPFMLIDLCGKQQHSLLLLDSQEMLDHLPDRPFTTKIPAYYPDECQWLFEQYRGKINVILAYSMLHYVFAEGNLFDFLDRSLALLADGGEMLMGDIPNISKRKRFFASSSGIRYHQEFTGTDEVPSIAFNTIEANQIDDSVILSLLMRCRSAGFDAYCLPQPVNLPMANRREDILIRKP